MSNKSDHVYIAYILTKQNLNQFYNDLRLHNYGSIEILKIYFTSFVYNI